MKPIDEMPFLDLLFLSMLSCYFIYKLSWIFFNL